MVDSGHAFSAEQIYGWLHSPQARELKHKVGVASPNDGSAKISTRLLKSEGWFFKTNLERRFPSKALAEQWVLEQIELSREVKVWHPQKQWFLVGDEQDWLAFNLGPNLKTLRELGTFSEKIRGWTDMIEMAFQTSESHNVCLDINPSNFGMDETGRLYYLDDEVLQGSVSMDYISSVILSRIAEEKDRPEEDWTEWGKLLRPVIRSRFPKNARPGLAQAFVANPLPKNFTSSRNKIMKEVFGSMQVKPQGYRNRTLVFADVHGNYPALKAVLARAKMFGVNRYVYLGDVVGYGPFPSKCIDVLAGLGNTDLVMGNHDLIVSSGMTDPDTNRLARETHQWTIDRLKKSERKWLAALPREYRHGDVLAVHGAPMDPNRVYAYVYELTFRDNLAYMADHDISLCFYGHTHVQFVHDIDENGNLGKKTPAVYGLNAKTGFRSLVNPGSVGQPRDGDSRAAFAIWDHKKNRLSFHRINYSLEEMVEALKAHSFPEDLVERLYLGR